MNKIKEFFEASAVILLIIIFAASQFYVSGTLATIDAAIFKKVVSIFKPKQSNASKICGTINKYAPEKLKNDPSLSDLNCEIVGDEKININQKFVFSKNQLNEELFRRFQFEMKKKACVFFDNEDMKKLTQNLTIKNNIYGKDDGLILGFEANKDLCSNEKFALENEASE